MSEHTEAPKEEKQPESPEAVEATEAPETPEEAEQHEHHPAKQSSGSSGPFLAMLLSIVAVIAVFLLWQQQQGLSKDTQTLQQSLGRLLKVVEQSHETQMQQIAEHTHPGTDAQLDRITELVQSLRGRLGQEKQEWFLAEMEYLLRTASHHLNLEHDRETALEALRQARQRMAMQDLELYQPIIQQVDKDIAEIGSVSLPDRNRIASELSALIDSIEQWPFSPRQKVLTEEAPPAEQPAPEKQVESETGLQRLLAKIWQDLKGLVTIRRNGEVARPLLQPQQRYFLQQNMQLKLQAARLALLSGNDSAYHESLNEAGTWLARYFDTSSLPVGEALSIIEQLATVDLSPKLPTMGDSLGLLHQIAMKIQPAQEEEAAAPVVPPPAEKKPASPSPKKPKPAPAKQPAPAAQKSEPPSSKTEVTAPSATRDQEQKQKEQNEKATSTTDDKPMTEDVPAPPQPEGKEQ